MASTSLSRDLARALDPSLLLRGYGIVPDPWQQQLLRERPARALLLCGRQAGKTLSAAAAALHEALYRSGALILVLAPSQRQSIELLRKARTILTTAGVPSTITSEATSTLELANGSRIVSLPAKEDTIRGFSEVALMVIDEAARVPDQLYFAVRPMLAVSNGRLLALSTPAGQQGWFYTAWHSPDDWQRTRITAADCPRISPEFLAEERRTMTPALYASEYECEFSDVIDAVFAHDDVMAALDPDVTPLFPGGW
jgi:Terminase large subunit, T4likevirus-type, N-terminal